MLKSLFGLALLVGATGAKAASNSTDFGIRTVPGMGAQSGMGALSDSLQPAGSLTTATRVDLRSVAGLGSSWGRVTSTYRSPAHNRAVGGVRNSFHLSGRAIDIARRPGVTHGQIAAAFRSAGYYLVESLDEGDHSHFAFGSGARLVREARPVQQAGTSGATQWRIVSAASAAFK